MTATYALTGAGLALTYAAGPVSLTLTLDETHNPFDGEHRLEGHQLNVHSPGAGTQVSGTLRYETVGRGGPIERERTFTLYLPDAPGAHTDPAELSATGAVVFADPESRADVTPEYRADSLTGTVSVAAQAPV
ncbi:hypothetical protein [Nocardia lijiangensis]|uniref:hypothetical protein n=1 Tax=Nocardia lijiangensis TaxID=299618 RepID=UPI00082C2A21|nr:hypothetical protein [Nocardia lijiangensis]